MSRNRRRSGAPVLIVAILLLILIAVFGIRIYRDRFEGSRVKTDLNAYLGISGENDIYTVLNNSKADFICRKINGMSYVDLETAKQYLNGRFYYGAADDAVFYCLPEGFYMVGPNETTLHAHGYNTTLTDRELAFAPVVRDQDGNLCLAVEFIAMFTDLMYSEYQEPARIRMETVHCDVNTADVEKKGALRVLGGIKSEVITYLEPGDKVTVLDRMDTWSKVLTEDAYIGYIENARLSDMYITPAAVNTAYTEPVFASRQLGKRVCLGWHYMEFAEANTYISDMLAYASPVNVVSPSWFRITDEAGNVSDLSSAEYVSSMHARGIQVWTMTSNFDAAGVKQDFLSSLASRTNTIDYLISHTQQLGADGINIDFENIDTEHGDDYIEFIRELSCACRNTGIILSVDNYVPYDFNDHYRIDEQGVFCDYVIIMGYDEHYEGSAEPGSVASIGYVRYGIERTLEEVPAEKVINAVPFYTRIWKASTASGLTSSAVGMQAAEDYVAANGLEQFWDETACQNYAQGNTQDGYYARVWLEDSESMAARISVMENSGLAGIAAWRLGLEQPGIWQVIADYVGRQ